MIPKFGVSSKWKEDWEGMVTEDSGIDDKTSFGKIEKLSHGRSRGPYKRNNLDTPRFRKLWLDKVPKSI